MPLTREEIERPRSPRQLVAFVESVRDRARDDAVLRTAGHRRTGYLKEFFDEVVPLSKFAVRVYAEDHTVKPILGNQGYDAEVRDGSGRLVERIEIANPIDGRAVAETGRELERSRMGGFRTGAPGDDIEDLIPIIARTAANKAETDYSDAAVVFNVDGFAAFEGFAARHGEQVARIRRTLADAGLKAKRVFVMLPSGAIERIDA